MERAFEKYCHCNKLWNVSLLRKPTDVYVCPACSYKQIRYLKERKA